MNSSAHPSRRELDLIHLGAGTETSRRHAEICGICGAHLARLAAPVAVPQWVMAEASPPRKSWRHWSIGGISVAAAAFLVLAVISPSDALRSKGGLPGVSVFRKHGSRVERWDGQFPVEPGDLLRLEIAPQGFRRIRVSSPASDGNSNLLYEGELPARTSSLLPVSFAVDPAGSRETLRVELSQGIEGTWSTELIIPKKLSTGAPHP